MKMRCIIWFSILFLFYRCDCASDCEGYIYDSESKTPLVNATVTSIQVNRKDEKDKGSTLTDSTGNFYVGFFSGGFFGCPTLKIRIEKQDYETKEVSDPITLDTIYITKEE